MPDSEYLTVTEVAERFRKGHSTVVRWCRTGKIESIRLPGGEYLIPRTAVEAIVRPAVQSGTEEP